MQEKPSYASRVPAKVLRGHVIMGALQITVGCLVIVCSVVGLIIGTWQNVISIGGGVWSGPFFIAAGVSGIAAGKSVKSCTLGCVITCLVFSILASYLAFNALIAEAVVTTVNRLSYAHGQWNSYPQNSNFMAYYALNILCTLLLAFEFVLAIVHAAFACRASCCCVRESPAAAAHRMELQQPIPVEITMDYHDPVYTGQQPVTQLVTLPDGQVVALVSSGSSADYENQPPFNPGFAQRQQPSYEAECAAESGAKRGMP